MFFPKFFRIPFCFSDISWKKYPYLLKGKLRISILSGAILFTSASSLIAQNAVPSVDHDGNVNPALIGLSDRISVNLVGSSYKDEESYFDTKIYETSMTSSQGSIGLRSRLLNTVLGLSTSKVQMVKVSDGRKITETESRAPSFQGSLTLSRYLSFGAGLIRNSRDYKNYDNSSLNGIRMIDRYNAGAVLNLGPLFSVTINSLTIMENLLQELPLVDAGPLLRWEWLQGVYGEIWVRLNMPKQLRMLSKKILMGNDRGLILEKSVVIPSVSLQS